MICAKSFLNPLVIFNFIYLKRRLFLIYLHESINVKIWFIDWITVIIYFSIQITRHNKFILSLMFLFTCSDSHLMTRWIQFLHSPFNRHQLTLGLINSSDQISDTLYYVLLCWVPKLGLVLFRNAVIKVIVIGHKVFLGIIHRRVHINQPMIHKLFQWITARIYAALIIF